MRENTWPQRLFLVLTLLLISAVYLKTMAPDIFLVDSGEFVSVAYFEGISHPAGSPLYGLLGGLFTRIPLGNIAFRANLLSLSGALLCLIVVFKFLAIIFPGNNLWAYSGLIFLSGQPHFWQKAVTTEVYSWLLFFFSALLFFLFRKPVKAKNYFCLALIFGAACSLHVTAIFFLPLFLFYQVFFLRKYEAKFFILICFAGLLTLSLYLYLPLRAVNHPPVNWGAPDNFKSFLAHIFWRSREVISRTGGWTHILIQGGRLVRIIRDQYLLPGLSLGLIGGYAFLRQGWKLPALFLLGILPFIVFYCLGASKVNPNNFVVVYLLLLPFWVNGLKYLGELISSRLPGKSNLYYGLVVIYLIANFTWGLSAKNLRGFYLGYDLIDNILISLPEKAGLRTRGDTVTFGLTYFIKTLGRRPDLLIAGPEPFDYQPAGEWSGTAYSVGAKNPKNIAAWGLVNLVKGENPVLDRIIWSYFRRRPVRECGDGNSWTREISALYSLYEGDYWRQTGRDDQAVENYRVVSRLGDYRMVNNIGLRYLLMKEYRRAEAEYRRLLEMRPDDYRSYSNLGNVYFELSRFSEALEYYQKSLELNPASGFVKKRIIGVREALKRAGK